MHPQGLRDRAPQFLHFIKTCDGEWLVGAAADGGLLLLDEFLDQGRAAENLQGRPRGGDGAVVHATEESGDQETHDFVVGNWPAIGVSGIEHFPQEIVLRHLSASLLQAPAAVVDDRLEELRHLPPGGISGAVPRNRSARHEDRQRQHALLHDMKKFTDAVLALIRMHFGPDLMAHQAADGSARQALDHRCADVHNAFLASPLLLEKLQHLRLECADIGIQAIVRQPLAYESELAHAGAVVCVVQNFWAENRNGEGIHLRLVEVLVHSEEELMPIAADQKDHVLGDEVHLEALAFLLVALFHEVQRTLEELDDGAQDRQAHAESRGRILIAKPPADQHARDDDKGCACWYNGRQSRILCFELHVAWA
mmetsp:Transcript_55215/g.160303  ORF Transcript_55215/g.160303 Transcript_55215/m.160303 type:complete len:367 (+) Transcript_55215:693-1793(+)